eukprot:1194704-Prorocentrum_minimum.AAC.3
MIAALSVLFSILSFSRVDCTPLLPVRCHGHGGCYLRGHRQRRWNGVARRVLCVSPGPRDDGDFHATHSGGAPYLGRSRGLHEAACRDARPRGETHEPCCCKQTRAVSKRFDPRSYRFGEIHAAVAERPRVAETARAVVTVVTRAYLPGYYAFAADIYGVGALDAGAGSSQFGAAAGYVVIGPSGEYTHASCI